MRFRSAFRALTFGSTLWAFVMVATTGAIHPAVIAIFSLVYLGALIREHFALPRPVWMWRILNLGAIGGAWWGWFRLEARIDTVVYLFLYLVANKAWNLNKNRDYLQFYTLGFFMVLAAAVSTASLSFAPMVVAYTMLMLATLVAYTMHRDCDTALNPDRGNFRFLAPRVGPDEPRRLKEGDAAQRALLDESRFITGGLVSYFAVSTLFVVVIALGLFFVIPRIEVGSLMQGFRGGLAPRQTSGFSDSVTLGGVGAIQTDPAIAMRVTPLRGESGLPVGRTGEFIRLRGAALEFWDGRRWDKAPQIAADATSYRASTEIEFPEAGKERPDLLYQIMLEPVGTAYLFLPDPPARVIFERRIAARADTFSRTIALDRAPPQMLSYKVAVGDSTVPEDLAAGAAERDASQPTSYLHALQRLVGDRVPTLIGGKPTEQRPRAGIVRLYPDKRELLLKIPANGDTETIERVAREWTGAISEPMAIARQMERKFQAEFEYSLDTSDFSNKQDHLSIFLGDTRRGHCEYFATAMTLMLRARDIPARIVNGYVSDEWSDTGGGYYVVRQQNAHSWVEAYINGVGWVTFDPTPAAGVGSARNPDTLALKISRWMDGIRLVWYRYIVDYTMKDQTALFTAIIRTAREKNAFSILDKMDRIFSDRPNVQMRVTSRHVMALGMVMLVFGLGALLIHEWRKYRRNRSTSGDAALATPRRPPIKPYLDLLKACEREEPRSPAATPLEYVRVVSASRPHLDGIVPLTESYYSARFNGGTWSEADSARAGQLLSAIEDAAALAKKEQRK